MRIDVSKLAYGKLSTELEGIAECVQRFWREGERVFVEVVPQAGTATVSY